MLKNHSGSSGPRVTHTARSQTADRIESEQMTANSTARNRHYDMLGYEICGCCGELLSKMTFPHINKHGYQTKEDFYRDHPRQPYRTHPKPNNSNDGPPRG